VGKYEEKVLPNGFSWDIFLEKKKIDVPE